jgi:hypothetical protein
MADIDALMKKIQALINKAESTEFPGEKAAFQAQAEKLMAQHRIAEEELIAASSEDANAITPDHDTVVILSNSGESEFRTKYCGIFAAIADHCGVRVHFTYSFNENSEIIGQVTGYRSDIRYAEVLYSASRLVFMAKLEPKVEPDLSDAENVYRLRESGMTRRRIAQLLWGEDTHSAHAKVGKLYKEHCEALGMDPVVAGRNVSAKTYRESFAASFYDELWMRLFDARNAAGAYGGGVELHGRKERVDEAFYERFPRYREQAERAKAQVAQNKAKTRKPRKVSQARMDRYFSDSATLGRSAGRSAAQEVQLRGVTGRGSLEA